MNVKGKKDGMLFILRFCRLLNARLQRRGFLRPLEAVVGTSL